MQNNMNLLIVILTSILFSLVSAKDELAIVTKSKGNVEYKSNTSDAFQLNVNGGLELYNDDLLKTGK